MRPSAAATLRAPWLACALSLLASSALAESASWRIAHGDVHVICPMTLGGSFEAKTSALTGSLSLEASRPASFTGGLTVDLKTLDTGIDLRNRHLRDEYLEVEKGESFDVAVLSDIRLGDVDAVSFQGRTSFAGTFLLHGTRKAIMGQAEIRREASSIRVEASFVLPIADYGIPRPQYLGVGVKNEIQVKVSLVAVLAPASGGGSR